MTKLKTATVTPAYGRDYVNGDKVKQAFLDGKDFYLVLGEDTFGNLHGQTYCSVRDFAKGAEVKLRFGGGLKAVITTT